MSGTLEMGVGVGYDYGFRPPFTAVQWQELEHQAMIYKYLVAGLPVPPDLVAPIRRSFNAISARFFNHPSLGYCSYYGKKFDPEPGRCRRTDGKKWRCSKDAHPDSKYCERHMHRGRNRSRKPVESQTTSQSLSTSISHITTGSSNRSGSFQSNSSGSFQNMPLYSVANSDGMSYGSTTTKLQMEPASYGINNKDYRYLHGMPPDADVAGSNTDNMWRLMPSQIPSKPMTNPKNDSQLLGGSSANPFEPVIKSKQQPQHCFFSSDIGSPGTVKQEPQNPMRSFFDEWPTSKESWSNLDEVSSKNNFSTTQLSISIPNAPSGFSSRSACSRNDA
ncbi:growth-regulating factor 4-like isoform X1 [Lycium ferocissimum]|uniref:growth-regulating factor 4-like isoform X1 n=1 Tax=Lycium ferocissimum TaxID=112874 RepID=UPI0028149EDF|nr:growth-regulating factor 4-like isoform X1 [Lycium ferocissimum]XP_059306560.1 growth-regulating factor 4-like isoform X1 [Lycium ferocissimum]XP_059306566.1 growth-regulating factor 4-like isoform X1 [Lycium ferocissimum]